MQHEFPSKCLMIIPTHAWECRSGRSSAPWRRSSNAVSALHTLIQPRRLSRIIQVILQNHITKQFQALVLALI